MYPILRELATTYSIREAHDSPLVLLRALCGSILANLNRILRTYAYTLTAIRAARRREDADAPITRGLAVLT